MTSGLPWPRGELYDPKEILLEDASGRRRLLQKRGLSRWSDGSIRWLLLDWVVEHPDEVAFTLCRSRGLAEETATESLSLRAEVDDGGAVVVNTGCATFRLEPRGSFLLGLVEVEGRRLLDADTSAFVVTDERGRRYRAEPDSVELVESGPVRAAAVVRGRLVHHGKAHPVRFRSAVHFFAGSPTVRFELTLHNPLAAGHPGGLWGLGQKGSVYFRDVSLTFGVQDGEGPRRISYSPEIDASFETAEASLELYQDSSGGRNWRSRNHVNRSGGVANRFRGYSLEVDGSVRRGLRATPIVAVEHGGNWLAVSMRQFWENFPKAIEANSDQVCLRLFPRQYADLHELQGGEQKTHVFHVAFGSGDFERRHLEWTRSLSVAHPSPEWYAESGVVPGLVPKSEDENADYLALVDAAIEGPDTFLAKRELIDDYGWRNFGDLYADHEKVYYQGPEPIVSHYNNQYDAVYGFGIQFMRGGDRTWFELMDDLARHVIDIDIYRTRGDKSAYNYGQFWHTDHYTDAGKSTHRSFPAAEGVRGGGPCGGHLYTTGLLMHYFLTGNEASREAVIESGRYAIDADDGSKSIFRFLDDGHTGIVSESEDVLYHGPGRNPGNTISALLDAHLVSGDRRFLDKCEQLVRRCIHPADDLEKRKLLDVERRWYYTIFLQALGRYLRHKEELGELDGDHAYASAALLHYAHWAAEHEYPYLEKPEVLEYPTETWAAQDMRKSEVFLLAARYCRDEQVRQVFLERSRFFFDDSVSRLVRLPTRTLCRPVVMMLSMGYSRAWLDKYGLTPAPVSAGEHDFGEPAIFVPQKMRAKRKLMRLAVLGAAVMLSVAVVAFVLLAG